MKHFKPAEFHGWLDKMSPKLLIKLDALRDDLDEPIFLSNDPGGIGRNYDASLSQHNYTQWGEVRAVDGYVPMFVSFEEFAQTAIKHGFTGIGFYTDWPSGKRGFHLDVREDRTPGNPAKWAARWVNGKNVYDVNFFELIHSGA